MTTFSHFLYEKIDHFSDLTALKVDERKITYAELKNKSLNIASVLHELKSVANETVGIIGQRNLSSFIGVLGTLFSGCNYTPINSKQSDELILNIIKQSKIKIVITDDEDVDFIINFLTIYNLLDQVKILAPESTSTNEDIFINQTRISKRGNELNLSEITEDDIAYTLYTSGSTGKPKGVQISQKNILSWTLNMHDIYDIGYPYNASNTYDLTFDLSVADMFFTWSNGGTLCVLPEYEKLLPSEYINREEITLWSSVPTIISFMNDMGVLKPNTFPFIERSLFCGEALTKKLADAWLQAAPNSTLENLYGPTEATIWISRYVYRKEDHKKEFKNGIIPIGRPFKGHTFKLIDQDDNLIEGQPGEIIYKGPQVSRGYLNNQEKTKQTFTTFDWDESNEIWYKSGDLGLVNNDGDYEFIGRTDNQIKFGGRRVELGEIESTLIKSGQLVTAIVIPLRNEEGIVKSLGAFTTSELTEESELLLRERFSGYMDEVFFPKHLFSIKAFPQNSSGKIDRKKLTGILTEKINKAE